MDKMNTIKFFFEYFDIKTFIYNNNPIRLLIIFGCVVLMMAATYVVYRIARRKTIKYTQNLQNTDPAPAAKLDGEHDFPGINTDIITKLLRSAMFLFFLLIWGWGFRQVVIGPVYDMAIDIIFTTLSTIAAVRFITLLIPFYMDIYMRKRGHDLEHSQARSLLPIINGVIWAIGCTFLLDNLGLKVSTIIAGLGIVGVAVGMAGQTIIKDIFGYIVILIDRPFRVGDFVQLSTGKSGNVVYVGPKSTRLMSLEGNLVICPNSEITSSIIENQGNIREREVEIELGIAYSNPMPLVRKFPDIIKEVVDSFPQCHFERCCMTSFGTANYLFQLIYKVREQEGGLNAFMNTQMDVNLAIQERETKEKISGAYPTQTILLTDMTPPKTS